MGRRLRRELQPQLHVPACCSCAPLALPSRSLSQGKRARLAGHSCGRQAHAAPATALFCTSAHDAWQVAIPSGISLCSCTHCRAGNGQEHVPIGAGRRGRSGRQLHAHKCRCSSPFLSTYWDDDSESWEGGGVGEREHPGIDHSWHSSPPPQKTH